MNWVTAEIKGIGGIYKETPEDFIVEEIPLYPCAGTGEHLYLWIEKSGISTMELIARLARGLHLQDRDIGYAGLKDSRALTRQWISIPAGKESLLANLSLGNARIIDQSRHGNKLRQGHLAGNRFIIRLRHIEGNAVSRAETILDILQQRGVPNLFGEQRYGVLGNSAILGQLLLMRDYDNFCRELMGDPKKIEHPGWQRAAIAYRQGELQQALDLLPSAMRIEQRLISDLVRGKNYEQAVLAIPKQRLRLFLSAVQSSYFDELLMQRIGALGELVTGDIAMKHDNGACFRVEDTATEQPRADRFEISPTAPLFGYKAMLAQYEPGKKEEALLYQAGLTLNSWKLGRGLDMPGERRALRVPLQQPHIVESASCSLTLSFSLPKGSYATSVLRELIK